VFALSVQGKEHPAKREDGRRVGAQKKDRSRLMAHDPLAEVALEEALQAA
jgi:hypothetical protein